MKHLVSDCIIITRTISKSMTKFSSFTHLRTIKSHLNFPRLRVQLDIKISLEISRFTYVHLWIRGFSEEIAEDTHFDVFDWTTGDTIRKFTGSNNALAIKGKKTAISIENLKIYPGFTKAIERMTFWREKIKGLAALMTKLWSWLISKRVASCFYK